MNARVVPLNIGICREMRDAGESCNNIALVESRLMNRAKPFSGEHIRQLLRKDNPKTKTSVKHHWLD